MARHPEHPSFVRVTLAIVLAAVALSATPAFAHDTYKGSYRKWPWAAGRDRFLTTLPGECPHCSGKQSSSAWKAIDANLSYETVYATSPGRIDVYEPSGGAAGKYMRIRDDDGSYITYEHLSQALLTKGSVVAGQPIAVSGNSGNSSGPHLHFQRHDGPSFWSNALRLTPISGHGGSGDPLAHTQYLSDNGGISYTAGGNRLKSMQAAYKDQGGYAGFGVTSAVGKNWMPCRKAPTWFRYGCNSDDRSEIKGSVQTYRGRGDRPRALMHPKGIPASYSVKGANFAAYTEQFWGYDWVEWIGYPVENRRKIRTGVFRQDFQFGFIKFLKKECKVEMYLQGWHAATYPFCR